MLIGLIGCGAVGSACKYGFEKLGHFVKTYDIKWPETKIQDVFDTEIVFIIVPTPTNSDGSCNTSIVEKSVKELSEMNYKGIVCIKSTVKPGTTEILAKKYSNLNSVNFVPEFLRERCAVADFTENHELLVIGTHDTNAFSKIVDCHGSFPKAIKKVSPTEAELLKYMHNTINSTRIIFANTYYEICKKLNTDYTTIKNCLLITTKLPNLYLDVNDSFRGYGGVCLPKDTDAMNSLVKELGLDLNLFQTISNENKKFKTTVFDGMRKE
jgi:UDPglucose 6-dehydrogenase